MTRWADWRILAGLAVAALLTAGGVLLVSAAHHPKAVIIRPLPRPTVRVSVTVRPRVVRTVDNEPPLSVATVRPAPAGSHHPTTRPTPHPTPRPTPHPTSTPPRCLIPGVPPGCTGTVL